MFWYSPKNETKRSYLEPARSCRVRNQASPEEPSVVTGIIIRIQSTVAGGGG
ncbi:hypothetical protein HanIR_Chr14g0713891 [Helianthus annuus]|nr:hypothetical protein HanIR_Chr14g0713891 [Helianthus annuus]